MSDDTGKHFWYSLTRNAVEDDDGPTRGKDRLGPFASREEASRALELAQERNREWDAKDGDG